MEKGEYRINSLNQNFDVTPDSSNYRVAGGRGFDTAKEIPDDFFKRGLLRGEIGGYRRGGEELAYFAHGNPQRAYAQAADSSHEHLLKMLKHFGPELEMPRNYVIEASQKFKERLPKNGLYIGDPNHFQYPVDGYPAHGLHRTLKPNKNPSLSDVINPMNRTGLKITQFDNGKIDPIRNADKKVIGHSSSMPTNEKVLYDRVTPFSERPLSTHAKNLVGEAKIASNALGLPAAAKAAGKAGMFVAEHGTGLAAYMAAEHALDSGIEYAQGREGTPFGWVTMPGTNSHSTNVRNNLREEGFEPTPDFLNSIRQHASREFDDAQGRSDVQRGMAGIEGFALTNLIAPGAGTLQTIGGATGLAKGIEMYHAGVENVANSYDIPGLGWYDRHVLGAGRTKGMSRKESYDKDISDTLKYGMDAHQRMANTYKERYGGRLASLIKPEIEGFANGGQYPSGKNRNILKDPINYKKIQEFNNLDGSEVQTWLSKPENKKWVYGQKMQDWGTVNAIPFLHKLYGGDEDAAYNHYVSNDPESEDQLSIK